MHRNTHLWIMYNINNRKSNLCICVWNRRRFNLFAHITKSFQFHSILVHIHVSMASLRMSMPLLVPRKSRVVQHLSVIGPNWLILYPSWICYHDCSKLPPFSVLSSLYILEHARARIRACTMRQNRQMLLSCKFHYKFQIFVWKILWKGCCFQ